MADSKDGTSGSIASITKGENDDDVINIKVVMTMETKRVLIFSNRKR